MQMVIKSISDLRGFELFIFDLDNTIYDEEDYLFAAYRNISDKLSQEYPAFSSRELHTILLDLYMKEGREKLFDKFLSNTGLGKNLLPICLSILRNFRPDRLIPIFDETRDILRALKSSGKIIFVLTNGNPEQQKNKIRSLEWEGLDEGITFILADEIEPKPSPAGVLHILERSGISADKSLFIGDSITDQLCAERSGIQFIDIQELHSLI